mgnify:CR=1 FL=1
MRATRILQDHRIELNRLAEAPKSLKSNIKYNGFW